MFDGKRVLITGGTGSWGQCLCDLLLKNFSVKEVVIFSRGELQQVLMQRRFRDNRVSYVIGDVRDYASVNRAMRHIDIVFHLAALKHVPICENHPQEAIATNIMGTTNVVNAAIDNQVSKVIDVSTDKAVEPVNLYGMTKAVGEKIMLQANSSGTTKFVCVRGGNVMGSNGSVIPYFVEQIRSGGPITVTDTMMTRFFLTLQEAIQLLFKAAEISVGGEIFVMNMPSCSIISLAQILMKHHGQVGIDIIGAKPGEKLHEVLIGRNESSQSVCYDSQYFMILPGAAHSELKQHYRHCDPLPWSEFTSDSQSMTAEQIETMLSRGGFL